ncbi:cysteine-rich small domain-containing protein [Intestinibacter sp.]|uniref:cysteine-rich small domain-containing protein n=1 Tax=Intestinibacter sp. TaxID=1965304 RepID=UPI002A9106E9|nr:cysteine-rich small domain-containing protein [Intestinibacter sp.]MDY5211322.1 cysteine-rich small domain-containing protein [Intestinibacter sp.]
MSYKFFSNTKCEYFPCHKTNDPENFNCLFCYCPLYALKDKCGGNFSYTEKGIKNCTNCTLPHQRKNYDYVIGKFKEIAEITKLDAE